MKYAAILGFGTVGSGVAELLERNPGEIAAAAGTEIRLKRIVDVRDFPESPFAGRMTKSFEDVERDPEITLVAETIGGSGVAYEFTRRALLAGKSVVTSNKQLVAEHGPELMAIAAEHGAAYLFEASVGGGIPILAPLRTCLGANRIQEIYGILNGTTNYILTEMFKNGSAFDSALARAQELGYAERDPRADVSGQDTCRKLAILCAMGFGRYVRPEGIETLGIENVTGSDVDIAGTMGYGIRLLGRALRTGPDRICAYVAPHLVPEGNVLAGVEGVTNGIVVRGDAVSEVAFCGPGAGKMPTASAVTADLITAARYPGGGENASWAEEKAEYLMPPADLESRWFIRGTGTPGSRLSYVDSAAGTDGYVSASMSERVLADETAEMHVLSRYRILE